MPTWVWLVPQIVVIYHAVNFARLFAKKLPRTQLIRSVVRTFLLLTVIQLSSFLVLFLAWKIGSSNIFTWTTGLQAIIALILLISSNIAWKQTKPLASRIPLTDSELPSVSVLVPARDETLDLENCLTALIASDYPKLEIIALDDCSANRRTPEIIRGFAHDGVRFIQGNEPPRTMLPKNHAYARLAAEASGELLIFIGVDVVVEPDTLRRLVESLIADKKDMMSLLPMRPKQERRKLSFIQAMRYWWELGWPRRIVQRPPVLSTLWIVRAEALQKAGGFAAAAQMITPEAYFAKRLAADNRYRFIRSTPHSVAVYSTKDINEQFATAVRVRYPQLHRRIAVVLLLSIFELFFLIAPFVLLPIVLIGAHSHLASTFAAVAIISLSSMYYLIAIRTHLNNLWLGLLTAPVAFILDVIMMHISMFVYEFGTVTWHERRLNRPMLEVTTTMQSH